MTVFRLRKLSIVSLFVAAGYGFAISANGTAFVLARVVPVLQIVDVCAAFICLPLLGLAAFRKARPVAAHGFLFMAYLFGTSNWMYAVVVLWASPPTQAACYLWAGITIFLSIPGRMINFDKSGSVLGFMAAFPVCALVNALLNDAPFATFIIGLALTYVMIALSSLLGADGRESFANSASNSDTRAKPADPPTVRAKAAASSTARAMPAASLTARAKPAGSLTGWEKYLQADARIISKEKRHDPSPRKMESSNPADKPAKKVVPCPWCHTKLSLATGKTGQVECPRCRRMFRAST